MRPWRPDLAGGRQGDPAQELEQRTFAGPVFADQAPGLAGLHLE